MKKWLLTLNRGILALMLGGTVWITGVNLMGGSRSMTSINFPGPTTPTHQQLPAQPQGVSGVVASLSGNQMPTNILDDSKSAMQPIRTKVWIFSGKIISPGSPRWPIEAARQHPMLLGWVTTDSQGKFQVGLPPGEYTLLAAYESDLYLNEFLADGSFSSIQVVSNQVTQMQMINTENAAF